MRHLLPALSLALLVGCVRGTACNAMYAPDQVHIDFSAFAFEAGEWRLRFDDVVCELELPGDGGDWSCIGAEAMVTLSADGEHIDEVSIWEFAPESFTVSLFLDGELVAEQEFSPVYDEDEPNGEGCGFRHAASVSFDGA